jgi:small multidrug resistance pump
MLGKAIPACLGVTPEKIAILLTIALSAVGVTADYFLKVASSDPHPVRTWSFAVGALIYVSMAFGWVFVMRHLRLANIGVFYSISTVLLLALIGVVFFRENLRPHETIGVILAVVSLILLGRLS